MEVTCNHCNQPLWTLPVPVPVPVQVRMQGLQVWMPEALRQQGVLGSARAVPGRPPDLEPVPPAAHPPGSAEQHGMLEAALHTGLDFKSAYRASPKIAAVRVRACASPGMPLACHLILTIHAVTHQQHCGLWTMNNVRMRACMFTVQRMV